jgi:hypothetical protein
MISVSVVVTIELFLSIERRLIGLFSLLPVNAYSKKLAKLETLVRLTAFSSFSGEDMLTNL